MQKVFLILLLAVNCLAGRGDVIGHSRDGTSEIRLPDNTGNLYETLNRSDRRYASGGRLVKTRDWEYRYDDLGNLVRKRDIHGATWRYGWNGAGMLTCVRRPDNREITFRY
ncbi:MAG: hypothetical protein LBE91_01785, partial [Tannerella sp.]|nr:hypothetical protein [Tannerella sp.]